MRWLFAIVIGLLSLIGIGASVAHYLQEPYNPGFLKFPVITAMHAILGGIYLAFAPFQFVKRIRTRYLTSSCRRLAYVARLGSPAPELRHHTAGCGMINSYASKKGVAA
jgi:hypothetical protein